LKPGTLANQGLQPVLYMLFKPLGFFGALNMG